MWIKNTEIHMGRSDRHILSYLFTLEALFRIGYNTLMSPIDCQQLERRRSALISIQLGLTCCPWDWTWRGIDGGLSRKGGTEARAAWHSHFCFCWHTQDSRGVSEGTAGQGVSNLYWRLGELSRPRWQTRLWGLNDCPTQGCINVCVPLALCCVTLRERKRRNPASFLETVIWI